MDEIISENKIDMMRHCIGFDAKRNRGYRNYYTVSEKNINTSVWRNLVRLGYAIELKRQYCDENHIQDNVFFLTKKGCRYLGLNKKEIERAMEGIHHG